MLPADSGRAFFLESSVRLSTLPAPAALSRSLFWKSSVRCSKRAASAAFARCGIWFLEPACDTVGPSLSFPFGEKKENAWADPCVIASDPLAAFPLALYICLSALAVFCSTCFCGSAVFVRSSAVGSSRFSVLSFSWVSRLMRRFAPASPRPGVFPPPRPVPRDIVFPPSVSLLNKSLLA